MCLKMSFQKSYTFIADDDANSNMLNRVIS